MQNFRHVKEYAACCKPNQKTWFKLSFFCLVFLPTALYADQFHYNNVILGDRASGMGGAFAAVADDASGVYYNPAGLAFALSNDISGSANAFYQKEVTYKKAAFEKDFVENSNGSLAPFFGALGKLDHIMSGLVFAFGYMTTDSDLKDQNDLITPNTTTRFHRTANVRANTNKFATAIAKRFGSSFAIGMGAGYLMVDELAQVYQDSASAVTSYEVESTGKIKKDSSGNATKRTDCCFRFLQSNVRERLQITGVEPMIGVQFAVFGSLSAGITYKKPILITQSYETASERNIGYTDYTGTSVDVNQAGVFDIEAAGVENAKSIEPKRLAVDNTVKRDGFKDWPSEARLGLAWFASTRALFTFDVINYSAVDSEINQYDRDAVNNFALGSEYYFNPSFPVRLGFFTNNDARPEPSSDKTDQPDSIDYKGLSLYVAFVQPNSQIALGGVLQQGTGKAQKVAGSKTIQSVDAFSWTAGFSVSHNF